MKPPFWGTCVVENIDMGEITPLINKEVLFASRWQFRKDVSAEQWARQKEREIEPVFKNVISRCQNRAVLEPRLVYGYFECRKQENALLVSPGKESKIKKTQRFDFPRQRQSPNLCVADFFPDGFVTMQLVTVGNKVIEEGVRLHHEKKYSEVFFLRGLAAEAAEALAEFSHRRIKDELGVPPDQGTRFSFGYPAAPQLMDQEKLYTLLDGSRIGVGLTETFQLVPEYSTSAIISVDPKARFFQP